MVSYDLTSLQLPVLKGQALKLFAAALEAPVTRPLLLGRLLRDGGVERLRAMRLDEAPAFYPMHASRGSGQPVEPAAVALERIARSDDEQEPVFSGIRRYSQAYRSGTTSPEEIVRRFLETLDADNDSATPIRAFIANDREDLMVQAQASTQRIRAGRPLSVLDGVPIAIKDELNQVPYPTTVGTSFLGRSPAIEDSTVVSRLRATGALLMGKTNMYEIGISPEGFNAHHGTARNPYNLSHDTGGSSSGSAAAVAAGFCPVAIGADGGGSIRVPASHCGLVGFKPTFGRVSTLGGAPLCWSLDHYGPIATSVADAAAVYAVIAGADAGDPMTQFQPPVTLADWDKESLRGVRLGVYWPWFNHASPDIVSICVRMLDHLVAAGAHLLEIQIPELEGMRIAHAVTILSEIAGSMENLKVNWEDFSPPTRINLVAGRAFTSFDYLQAQRLRSRAMMLMEQVFSEVDVVMSPTTAMTAPKIPEDGLVSGWSNLNTVTELMRYAFPGNLAGLPAITVPAGYDVQGLPIGIQAMGRAWEEHVLLRVAGVIERNVEKHRPSLYYDLLE